MTYTVMTLLWLLATPDHTLTHARPQQPAPPPVFTDARDRAINSLDAGTRKRAAAMLAQQNDAHTVALLWVLAHDVDLAVRKQALASTQARCHREPASLCVYMLRFFLGDKSRELDWSARDALLAKDIEAALSEAEPDYKLDLLGKLGGGPAFDPKLSRRLLRQLSADIDPQVQDNAAWLLEREP